MAHTSHCATAVGNKCTCECHNALHGAAVMRAFVVISEESCQEAQRNLVGRLAYVEDDSLRTTIAPVTRPLERADRLSDVLSTVLACAIDQLSSEQKVDAVQALAKGISQDVADAVVATLAASGRKELADRRSSHFWCVFVAKVCELYDRGFKLLEGNAEALVDAIMGEITRSSPSVASTTDPLSVAVARRGRKVTPESWPERKIDQAFDQLEETLTRAIVLGAVKAVLAAVSAMGEQAAMQYVRIIGLIICPDPDRHPAVIHHCLWPLLEEPILNSLSQEVSAELRAWVKRHYPFM